MSITSLSHQAATIAAASKLRTALASGALLAFLTSAGCLSGAPEAAQEDGDSAETSQAVMSGSSISTCQRASDEYGIDSGVTWGFAPQNVQAWWAQTQCSTHPAAPNTCQRASDEYGISAGVTWGFAPQNVRDWWVQTQCGTHPTSPNACQAASDKYGIDAGVSYNFAPQSARDWWAQNQCTTHPVVSACQTASNEYGIDAGVSWGFAPSDVQSWWAQSQCATHPPISTDVAPVGRWISMMAGVNQRYVSAEDGGNQPLLADRDHAQAWETFRVLDEGNGNVALLSMSNNHYVTAMDAGNAPLRAAAIQVGPWEVFHWEGRGNGDFALKALVNGKYVSAENAGQGALIANHTQVGTSETFHLTATGAPNPDAAMVSKFAPRLRFDGDDWGYPMSAQTFYSGAVVNHQTTRLENNIYYTTGSGTLPTYYQTIECGSQVRIKYWWFYGFQRSCDQYGSGSHNGDWENVIVTLSEDRSSVAAVSFSMHGHYYTRLANRGGFDVEEATHPVVYVAKSSHAAHYTQGGSGATDTCLPWEEYRNNTTGVYMDSWRSLVNLDAGTEPWMVADRSGGFYWGPNGTDHYNGTEAVGTHPTQDPPTCSMNAADWTTDVPTWWHSQCKTGDRDDGTSCHTQCRSGYTDMGATCTNWSIGSWDTYGQYVYSYDYWLPTSNLGLLNNDYH